MNNRQLYYCICDLVVCIVIGTESLSREKDLINFGITFIAEALLKIVFIVMQRKGYLTMLFRDCFLIASYLLCQILQIEFMNSHHPFEYTIFMIIKLFGIMAAMPRLSFRILIFTIIYIYICARLSYYTNMYSYLGLAFLPLLFVPLKDKDLVSPQFIDFLKETVPLSMIIIDADTKLPLFHSNQMESEFNLTNHNKNSFVECLYQFQDQSHTTLHTILEQKKFSSPRPINQQFQKLQEVHNEEYFYAESPLKKVTTFLQDEINEEKQDFINIESPKAQDAIKISVPNQFNDDTPQNVKMSKYSQFKDSQYKLYGLTDLKQKKLNIQINHCIWNFKEAFFISIKDLEHQRMMSILNDELDESKKQNDNKDQILATVFHDFKTPINGICAIVETLEEKVEMNQQSKYYLRIIRKNVYLMLYMIYDILDFARIQKNQLRLSVSDFYLNEVIDEVVELVAIQAESKGVVIQTHYDIPSYQIHSDPIRMKQILMNFISNSLKFTEQGSITISVESPQTDKAQHIVRTISSKNVFNQQQSQQTIGQLRKQLSGKSIKQLSSTNKLVYSISISDTGCGISDLIKPKLFNMYATFPGREVSNKCGTGIGLMVCKKLIKLLGPSEKIDLWSEENKGTKMTFQIYSRLPDDPKRSPNYISVFKQESSSKNFNIDSPSLMDDQKSVQQRFVRSSVLRVFSRPVDKNDTEADLFEQHPDFEDVDQSKLHNINIMQNLRSPTVSRIKNKEFPFDDDSQEVLDPRVRLQKLLHNKQFSILIVDDQPFNVLAIKLLLQDISTNITYLEAYNGQQAINKLQAFQKNKNIRYVFMDLQMPILNGWQATKQIREMICQKLIEEVKIIAISGYDDESEQERCANIGFDAFVTKPVKLEMLAEVFAQLEMM